MNTATKRMVQFFRNQHTTGEKTGNHPPTDCSSTAMSVDDKVDKPRRRALVSLKK